MGKKIAVMQPYIFPWLGYFQLIDAVDKFIIYDDVNFIKRGWINRNRILLNNSPHMFSIPLIKPSQNRLITETFVNEEVYPEWKRKFLRTLEYGYYKKADFFNQTYNIVEEILNYDISSKTISELCYMAMSKISIFLEINTDIIKTSCGYNNRHLKGPDRIMDFCEQEKASVYINSIGGKELYSHDFFEEKNIKLNFISTSDVKYSQTKNDFISHLSIIDMLMFLSKEEIINIIKTEYKLVE